jgi:predicted Zn-dependent protease
MSVRSDVLLWAQRVVGRKDATPCQTLDIPLGSAGDVAQQAFHKIARMAHPDLHRRTLTPEELELVTTAYARAAAAYQELRGPRPTTTRMRPIDPDAPAVATTAVIPTSPRSNKAVVADEPAGSAQAQMNSKALIYYRKAELALRRGELTGAVLQLKMAIASDPQSAFLRSALVEVEAGVAKKP